MGELKDDPKKQASTPPEKSKKSVDGAKVSAVSEVIWDILMYLSPHLFLVRFFERLLRGNRRQRHRLPLRFLLYVGISVGASAFWFEFLARGISSRFAEIWVAFIIMNILTRRWRFQDYSALLRSNKRYPAEELPEPTEREFTLMSTGKKWIKYDWLSARSQKHFVITGDLNKGIFNAVQVFMLNCIMSDTIIFALDGNPAGGIKFEWFEKSAGRVLAYEDREDIHRAIAWLSQELDNRIAEIAQRQVEIKNYDTPQMPWHRIVVFLDESLTTCFLPAAGGSDANATRWHLIRPMMSNLLKSGKQMNIHFVCLLDPSSRWLALYPEVRTHFEVVSLYGIVPFIDPQGTDKIYQTIPVEHAFLDVVMIRRDGENVIGKLPYVSRDLLQEELERNAGRIPAEECMELREQIAAMIVKGNPKTGRIRIEHDEKLGRIDFVDTTDERIAAHKNGGAQKLTLSEEMMLERMSQQNKGSEFIRRKDS